MAHINFFHRHPHFKEPGIRGVPEPPRQPAPVRQNRTKGSNIMPITNGLDYARKMVGAVALCLCAVTTPAALARGPQQATTVQDGGERQGGSSDARPDAPPAKKKGFFRRLHEHAQAAGAEESTQQQQRESQQRESQPRPTSPTGGSRIPGYSGVPAPSGSVTDIPEQVSAAPGRCETSSDRFSGDERRAQQLGSAYRATGGEYGVRLYARLSAQRTAPIDDAAGELSREERARRRRHRVNEIILGRPIPLPPAATGGAATNQSAAAGERMIDLYLYSESDVPRFYDAREPVFLIDGRERIRPVMSQSINSLNYKRTSSERALVRLTPEQFRRISTAGKLEARIGPAEIEFSPEAISAIRDFAQCISTPAANAPIK